MTHRNGDDGRLFEQAVADEARKMCARSCPLADKNGPCPVCNASRHKGWRRDAAEFLITNKECPQCAN